jgi:DsbC/DsbD-like thiol-disulfide interchange protein
MQTTPFTIAANNAKDNGNQALAARITTEGKICHKVATAMLAAGFTVSVHDGEEMVVRKSTSLDEIMQALFATDEDYMIAHDAETGKAVGKVYLVYGNDGYDVINDYSTTIENLMRPVNDYADSLCLA